MKKAVIIVISVSAGVLLALPALYIFIAYQTHRERQRWKKDYDASLERIEAERQKNARPTTAAAIGSVKFPAAAATPSLAARPFKQTTATARPAPSRDTRSWAPSPPPAQELDVFRSSPARLSSQAGPAPRETPQGGGSGGSTNGKNTTRPPVPGSTRAKTPGSTKSRAGRRSRASGKPQPQPQPQQQQEQEDERQTPSYGATTSNGETSQGTRPFPPPSRLPPPTRLSPASFF